MVGCIEVKLASKGFLALAAQLSNMSLIQVQLSDYMDITGPGRETEDDLLTTTLAEELHAACSGVRCQCGFKYLTRQQRIGFISAVRSILKLAPGALTTAGVPCSSYVFMNRSTSQRSPANPLGRETLGYVADANRSLGFC
ncbi:unnamed protein product [Symbiodinium sp. CCMP2592]|nr:unnamed protein product [Symbiodinium sp. CCMP2592]